MSILTPDSSLLASAPNPSLNPSGSVENAPMHTSSDPTTQWRAARARAAQEMKICAPRPTAPSHAPTLTHPPIYPQLKLTNCFTTPPLKKRHVVSPRCPRRTASTNARTIAPNLASTHEAFEAHLHGIRPHKTNTLPRADWALQERRERDALRGEAIFGLIPIPIPIPIPTQSDASFPFVSGTWAGHVDWWE